MLLGAHFCGDILLNGAILAGAKRSGQISGKVWATLFHGLIHGVLAWAWLWGEEAGLRARATATIFVSHCLIDYARTAIEIRMVGRQELRVITRKDAIKTIFGRAGPDMAAFVKKHGRTMILLGGLDQLAHLGVILVLVQLAGRW